jgi:hypothetical protein
MARSSREHTVEIEGRGLKLSSVDKPMYPAVGFAKGQVIDNYIPGRAVPTWIPVRARVS